LSLRGTHNESNALAALALTNLFVQSSGNSSPDALDAAIDALKRFPGLPHRCRRVAERCGVEYIDDSKGTNVGATVAALAGLAGPLVLIAGGVGKGADFAPLASAARGKVKAAVLIGQAAKVIEAAFDDVCPTVHASDMSEAVQAAAALAAPGDTVLLSPACASLDMFRDYRARGEAFAAAVEELPA
jgi:UDP-N-acetylmuramoylalanine--D-glutamate ligase